MTDKVLFLMIKVESASRGDSHVFTYISIGGNINYTSIQFTCRNVDSVVLEIGVKRKSW